MNTDIKKLALAAHLYEKRQSMKILLGDKYADKINHCSNLIGQVQKASSCDILPALTICIEKSRTDKQYAEANWEMLVAAAIEMLEAKQVIPTEVACKHSHAPKRRTT